MRIQFTFATPLKALKTAEVALFLVRKICEKRKKEEDGDFSCISDVGAVTAHDACCHCIHSSCLPAVGFICFNDCCQCIFPNPLRYSSPFFFLKKKSSVRDFGLCHEGF